MNKTLALTTTFILLAGCGEGERNNLGSRYLASADVGAEGGALVVAAADSTTLAGTKLTVPAGALDSVSRLTIAPPTAAVVPADVESVGPGVDFGPDGQTFATPVEVLLPVQDGLTVDDIEIHVLEADGTRSTIDPIEVADGFARFTTTHFTGFQGGRRGNNPGRACQASDCGTPPNTPAYTCDDGTQGGFTGQCLGNPAMGCNWEVIQCNPACLTAADCSGNLACALRFDTDNDGTNDAGTCEQCATDADCAPGQTCSASFVCQGGNPTCGITVSPSSLTFPSIVLGTTSTDNINVSVTGGATANITRLTITGNTMGAMPFSSSLSVPTSIGNGLQIPITYSPSANLQDAAQLDIETDQSACGTFQVRLFGSATPCRGPGSCPPGMQCSALGICQ